FALKLPELVAGLIGTNARSSAPSETDFVLYCFDCTRLAEGVGKHVNLTDAIVVSRSFLATSLRNLSRHARAAKASRTITVQCRMSEDPNLSTDEFSTEQHGRTVTRYKSRNSSVSVYQENEFFTVTNDFTFDLFVRVN
ncbi:hypothetical protein AAVH_29705, partial [Aphelenchoides avenae]